LDFRRTSSAAKHKRFNRDLTFANDVNGDCGRRAIDPHAARKLAVAKGRPCKSLPELNAEFALPCQPHPLDPPQCPNWPTR
jgi:hypothetical protein